MKEYEIGLIDIAGVFSRRKRLIAGLTAVCALAAAVAAFVRPNIWEVDAILYPARISVPDDKGGIKSFMVMPFPMLAGQLEAGELVPYIARKSGLAQEDIPRYMAQQIPGTNQVRIFVRDRDIEKTKLALGALLEILESNLNDMLDVKLAEAETDLVNRKNQAAGIEARISEAERKLETLNRESRAAESRYAASLDEEKVLAEKIRTFEDKIAGLEERLAVVSGSGDPEADRDMLAVSSLILANAILAGAHSDTVKSGRALRDKLRLRIDDNAGQRGRLEAELASSRQALTLLFELWDFLSKARAAAIRAHILKEPAALSRPIGPHKMVPIALAAAAGFLLSVFLAFLLEIAKLAGKRPGAVPGD